MVDVRRDDRTIGDFIIPAEEFPDAVGELTSVKRHS